MVHTVSLANGYIISDDRGRIGMEMVLTSLARTYWAAERPRAVLARSWANCLPFGVYAPSGEQVGFGRLLTDYALRAHLGDVFIHSASRGLGLGRSMVETILAHPELTTVDHWTLSTADAHALYGRYGFQQGTADKQMDGARSEPCGPKAYCSITTAARPPRRLRTSSSFFGVMLNGVPEVLNVRYIARELIPEEMTAATFARSGFRMASPPDQMSSSQRKKATIS